MSTNSTIASIPTKPSTNVIAYIDGFNLYFGLKAMNQPGVKWLDIHALLTKQLRPGEVLVEVNYFTARVKGDQGKQNRQNTYLKALESTGVKIYYGNYQKGKAKCRACGATRTTYSEKRTDVNIATHMLVDSFQGSYDKAILITGDSDLVPPVEAIVQNNTTQRVMVFFPPNRNRSVLLKNAASAFMTIGDSNIKKHQLPAVITLPNGSVLRKPTSW